MINRSDTWEQDVCGALYEAILERMIVTYMLNALVKTGIKRPMKNGIIEHLKARQASCNQRISLTVRDIDRQ